jgi:malate dehydrogenase (oxaloacetate-decarboxylating)(NADP+)
VAQTCSHSRPGPPRSPELTLSSTGSVILGGFVAAAKAASGLSGRDPKDHKVVFLGGGSAAIGVAKEMMNYFRMLGLSEQEAKERFWLIDTKGLITETRQDVVDGRLAEHKKYFIRRDTQGQEYKTLLDVIEYVKPTTLVGLSTTFGAFPEPVVRRMAELNQAPIIFPLSNPTSKCELSFEDALNWTDGRVLYASGSPYDPVVYDGQLREPGQGSEFPFPNFHIPPPPTSTSASTKPPPSTSTPPNHTSSPPPSASSLPTAL